VVVRQRMRGDHGSRARRDASRSRSSVPPSGGRLDRSGPAQFHQRSEPRHTLRLLPLPVCPLPTIRTDPRVTDAAGFCPQSASRCSRATALVRAGTADASGPVVARRKCTNRCSSGTRADRPRFTLGPESRRRLEQCGPDRSRVPAPLDTSPVDDARVQGKQPGASRRFSYFADWAAITQRLARAFSRRCAAQPSSRCLCTTPEFGEPMGTLRGPFDQRRNGDGCALWEL
jgi:hypothetical protein